MHHSRKIAQNQLFVFVPHSITMDQSAKRMEEVSECYMINSLCDALFAKQIRERVVQIIYTHKL